jgi:hypothetical protein
MRQPTSLASIRADCRSKTEYRSSVKQFGAWPEFALSVGSGVQIAPTDISTFIKILL